MITNIELEKDEARETSKRYCLHFYVTGKLNPIDLWIYSTQDKFNIINSLLEFIKTIMYYDQK